MSQGGRLTLSEAEDRWRYSLWVTDKCGYRLRVDARLYSQGQVSGGMVRPLAASVTASGTAFVTAGRACGLGPPAGGGVAQDGHVSHRFRAARRPRGGLVWEWDAE